MSFSRLKSTLKPWTVTTGDSIGFSVFKSCLAFALLLNWLHLLPNLKESLTSHGFHLSGGAAEAIGKVVFTPLPNFLLPAFVFLAFAALILLAMRKASRTMALLSAAAVFYFLFTDPPSSSAQLKIGILGLILVAAVSKEDLAFLWPIYIGRVLLVSIYFMAGWRKTVYGGWLDNFHGLEGILQGDFQTPLDPVFLTIFPSFFWSLGQVAVVCFQLLAPFLFFNPSTRKYALLCGGLFHLGIGLMMRDLIFFSLVVISFYPLFIPPSDLRAWGHRIKGLLGSRKP